MPSRLASFSGLMGYFMAQAKFEHKPAWWVPLGLVVAAVLNGLFSWLISEASGEGTLSVAAQGQGVTVFTVCTAVDKL